MDDEARSTVPSSTACSISSKCVGTATKVRFVQPQGEVGAGLQARNGDALSLHLGPGDRRLRDRARTVLVAHGRTAGQQCVPVGEKGVGVDGDGRDLEFAP